MRRRHLPAPAIAREVASRPVRLVGREAPVTIQ